MVYRERGFLLVSLLTLASPLATACVGTDETSAEVCLSDEHDDESSSAGEDVGLGEDDGPGEDEGDGDGDETSGGFSGCAALDGVEACMDQPGCTPVFGRALVNEDQGWCSDPTVLYLGCVSTLDMCPFPEEVECDPCPGGDEILCDDDGYWIANGCVPEGLEQCPAPGPLRGDCE